MKNNRTLSYEMAQKLKSEDLENIVGAGTWHVTGGGSYNPQKGFDGSGDINHDH